MGKLYESEEETKLRYITPALQKAGWSSHKMLMEYSLRKDRFKIVPGHNMTTKVQPSTRNKPDYLLCKSVNFPIAVVEAKSTEKTASDGIDQAKVYAEMLDIPFAYSSAGDKFIEYDYTTGSQKELPLDEFPSPDDLWNRWCVARGINDEDSRHKMENALYYTTDDGKIPRYYQMLAINKTVNAVIADKQKRILLVMATGTGKTYTAFQIIWRLLKGAKAVKNVLYLADRNPLVDQTIVGDFQPFKNLNTKIRNRKIDTSHQVYFGLYQQLKGGDDDAEGESLADVYKQVSPDFFDLIIVDECHRGSAREESSWRAILDYFSSAIQIGLTATPSHKLGADNAEYFGEPIYTYTLKQGIEDGFLAPYQVVRVSLDKDVDGWEPEEGERDLNDKEIPKRKYTLADYDSTIILKSRTRTVAAVITEYLHRLGRMSKTIVFCTTQRHALELRDELRKLNEDMMKVDANYIVRMTGDDQEGRALFDDFISVSEKYPVVVTTSKLLTTGADTKCVKLIVLDANIRSMTEFKQIIGRGTRLREDADKTFFTILDFRNASELFKDKDFDGDPDWESEWGKEDSDSEDDGESGGSAPGGGGKPGGEESTKTKKGGKGSSSSEEPEKTPRTVYVVGNSVEVSVTGESISYLDSDGKLVVDKFKDYTRKNILECFGSEADFMEVWNGPEEKQKVIQALAQKGILIEQLRKEMGNPDYDEFDLVVSVAFGATPQTRQMRSSRVKRGQFLDKYQGIARDVLETLLDIYAHEGVCEVDSRKVLQSKEFKSFGGLPKIIKSFGGVAAYDAAVKAMEKELYLPVQNQQGSKTNKTGLEA